MEERERDATTPRARGGLLLRMVVVTVAAILAIEVVILVPTTIHFRRERREHFFLDAEAHGWPLVPRLAAELATGAPRSARLEALLRRFGPDAVLFSRDGAALVGVPRPGRGELAARALRTDNGGAEKGEWVGGCYVVLPVRPVQGPALGALVVVRSGDRMRYETQRYVLRVLGLVLVICSVAGAAVVGYLHQTVIRPIRRIVAANVQTIVQQAPAHLIDPADIPPNELGDIMRTRRAMLDSLRSARREIEEKNEALARWSRTLEERVEARTRELHVAQERALQAEKLATIGALGAGVAHEIHNPLGIVNACVEDLRGQPVLTDAAPEARAEAEETLAAIQAQVRRCKRIIDTLLRFSRSNPVGQAPLDLCQVLRDTVDLVRPRAVRSGRSLELRLPEEPRVYAGRKLELQQAVVNLLENALDATPAGGTVTVSVRPRGEGAEVRVADTGPGIPDELRARVFEPFFTTKPPNEGTGLGLSLARSFVETCGGELCYEPGPEGRGAVFRILLADPLVAG